MKLSIIKQSEVIFNAEVEDLTINTYGDDIELNFEYNSITVKMEFEVKDININIF